MNLAELLLLKYPNADFTKDILLSDFGNGVEISGWNLEDPKPTQEDLANWAVEYDLKYRQQLAVQGRRYPTIGDQLDMLYKDMLNNTTTWKDTITAIKDANPKPQE